MDANEAWICVPSVSSQALYHWAPALPLFSNKLLVIRAGIHQMPVRIANREDPDQTASSEAVWSVSALFFRPLWKKLVFEPKCPLESFHAQHSSKIFMLFINCILIISMYICFFKEENNLDCDQTWKNKAQSHDLQLWPWHWICMVELWVLCTVFGKWINLGSAGQGLRHAIK